MPVRRLAEAEMPPAEILFGTPARLRRRPPSQHPYIAALRRGSRPEPVVSECRLVASMSPTVGAYQHTLGGRTAATLGTWEAWGSAVRMPLTLASGRGR